MESTRLVNFRRVRRTVTASADISVHNTYTLLMQRNLKAIQLRNFHGSIRTVNKRDFLQIFEVAETRWRPNFKAVEILVNSPIITIENKRFEIFSQLEQSRTKDLVAFGRHFISTTIVTISFLVISLILMNLINLRCQHHQANQQTPNSKSGRGLFIIL